MKNLFLPIFAAIIILVSCEQETPNYTYSNLEIELSTSTSRNFEKVFIEIENIKIHFKSQSNEEQVVKLINNGNNIFNILDRVSGKRKLLGSTQIAQGSISKITLSIGQNNSVVKLNNSFNLEYSSPNNPLEIPISENINYDSNKIIYVNFNVNLSVIEKGNENYELKPVIKIYSDDNSGSIEGTIAPDDTDAEVIAISESNTFETFVDKSGYFNLQGLTAGYYDITITPNNKYCKKNIEGLIVERGHINNIGTINLEPNGLTAKTLNGNLNINPSSSKDYEFILQTPSGQIDFEVIYAQGDTYSYTGPATKILILPKANGNILEIDGNTVTLDKNTRYTISSTEKPMEVNLRNIKNGNGHWWININGNNISISPIP